MSAQAKLHRNGKLLLLILILTAMLPFFFVQSTISFLGISLFAWLLVMVMIVTPLLTLAELLVTQREDK